MAHPKTDKTLSRKIGRLIEQSIKAKGIKQKEIAETLKVHPSSVTQWKKGRGVISLQHFIRLAELLGFEHMTIKEIANLNVNEINIPKAVAGQIIRISGFYRCKVCKTTIFLKYGEKLGNCKCGSSEWEKI